MGANMMESRSATLKTRSHKGQRILSRHRCRECGSRMIKADSIIENGIRLVWYDCSLEDCYGSRLEKQKVT